MATKQRSRLARAKRRRRIAQHDVRIARVKKEIKRLTKRLKSRHRILTRRLAWRAKLMKSF